jgi:uncharacterized surface protein with fasciclin (FAS1) repeats
MPEKHGMGAMIITLVVALVLGGGLGYALGNNKSDDSSDDKMTSTSATAGTDGVTVGGAKMVSTKDIVDNAVNAKNVTTVVSLVQKADLVETLKGTGPFTVFAPNNDAFAAVPKDILDKVGGNKELLTTVLTYHVVAGTYTTADLRAMAAKGETLTTVQGGKLSVKVENNQLEIVDATGQKVMIETPDVISSNGVTHVIKNVLLPVDPSTL